MQDERINYSSEGQPDHPSRQMKKARIRLLIVDDHAKYRSELHRLLQDEPDIHICGETGDEVGAVQMACKLKPDVILMDLELAETNSIQAIRAICIQQPQIRVILMVMHHDVSLVMEGLRAGAWAHISKFSRPTEFASVVRGVHQGIACVDSQIMGQILEELHLA